MLSWNFTGPVNHFHFRYRFQCYFRLNFRCNFRYITSYNILTLKSDYTDTNEYADSAEDIGFKVRLQCARQGTLEKPAAAGGRPCAQLVRAEAIMGAIEGVAYMIGGIMRVAAAAQTVEHL